MCRLYSMIDAARQADLVLLEKEMKTATPERRRKIEQMILDILHESRSIRMMRSSLIKAHRSGNVDEIKDDHDFMEGKKKYAR